MTRKLGDHGTAQQAIDFLLTHRQAPGEETSFLRGWTHGDLIEWPEFYEWLDKQDTDQ